MTTDVTQALMELYTNMQKHTLKATNTATEALLSDCVKMIEDRDTLEHYVRSLEHDGKRTTRYLRLAEEFKKRIAKIDACASQHEAQLMTCKQDLETSANRHREIVKLQRIHPHLCKGTWWERLATTLLNIALGDAHENRHV